PRGRPRSSNQSTACTSNALTINASNTGTTMTSSLLTAHISATTAARMTSKRHAQAAALLTSGSTAASSGLASIWPAYRARCAPGGPSGGRFGVGPARSGYDPGTTATRSVSRFDCRATCAVTLKHVPPDAPTRKLELTREATPRGKYWWVRWVILGI